MYLCYLDESGTPDPGANTDHFIFIGLAIPADTWKAKDLEVLAIKQRYGLGAEEIHTAWMMRDYPEQKRVPDFEGLDAGMRRKAVLGLRSLNLGRSRSSNQTRSLQANYKKTAAYVHLTRDERRRCVHELAMLCGGWEDARLFAEAKDKTLAPELPAECFERAFEQVVTRFNTYLEKSGDSIGLLIQDNNSTISSRFTDLMRKYYLQGTTWRPITRIVETPLFVDSQLTSMVQIVDIAAYATRRFFEKKEEPLFEFFYPRFNRDAEKLVGLRHFTGATGCACRVCKDHGR